MWNRNYAMSEKKNDWVIEYVKYRFEIKIEIVTDEQKDLPNRWALKYSFESTSHDLQMASLVCYCEEEEANRSSLFPLLDHQRNTELSISNAFSFLMIFPLRSLAKEGVNPRKWKLDPF